ncbi:MAG TPA: Lrp/AsnC family transcriptional regulator, partial [Methylocella sp.]|nr:Lrp/AsnC family transcriptional regulator [Methylocella sp.]
MARRHVIDEMDLKIMKRLQLDARISNVRLAEDVHLSPSACLERVKALEKAGLIRRYIADFDLARIRGTVMLLVEVILKNHREADFERFLAAIRKRIEVLECYKIGGRIDYLMRVVCRDIDHYSELSDFMSRGEL